MRNCIITGSGRSGTSAVAGALITANSGYYSGGAYVPPRISNPDGTYEAIRIREINEEILAQVVPERSHLKTEAENRQIPTQWQRWLARIPVDAFIPSSKTIEHQIREQVSKPPYCLKDPRFSYTLHLWKPFLDNCVYVCMFRNPDETAKSIIRFTREFEPMRDLDISYEQALKAWSLLNRHILENHYTNDGNWIFLHMDQLVDGASLDRLVELTGAKVERSLIRSERIRTRSSAEVPPEVQDVYSRLCDLAKYQPK